MWLPPRERQNWREDKISRKGTKNDENDENGENNQHGGEDDYDFKLVKLEDGWGGDQDHDDVDDDDDCDNDDDIDDNDDDDAVKFTCKRLQFQTASTA